MARMTAPGGRRSTCASPSARPAPACRRHWDERAERSIPRFARPYTPGSTRRRSSRRSRWRKHARIPGYGCGVDLGPRHAAGTCSARTTWRPSTPESPSARFRSAVALGAVLAFPDPVKNSGDDAVTTREVELVDRGQRGFDALDEHLLQAPACAKQARLHRLLCDAQTLRDLGAAHSLDRAQDEDRAEVFGKRRHRFLEQRSHLDIARLLLWARSPRRGHELWLGKTRLSETC